MSNFFESLPEPFAPAELHIQEVKLAARISKGDSDALSELVLRNMREAILYTRCVSRNVEPGQLMSICYDALLRNAKRFNPERQRFFAYAKPGLRGALYRDYNKRSAHATVPMPDTVWHPNGRTKVHKDPADLNNSHDMPELECVQSGQVVEPDMESIFTRDRWELVKPIVEQKCSEQEKMVLTLNYVSGLNFQEIGDLLGVTRSAIQRTHWRAVKKLRNELTRKKQLFL
jgi:RNA polymerase sigma factor (sigma-70 family)